LDLSTFLHNASSHHQHLDSFPTRRSSDLKTGRRTGGLAVDWARYCKVIATDLAKSVAITLQYGSVRWWPIVRIGHQSRRLGTSLDRKSTRLNSSHGSISYAVICLKKKKIH